MIPVESLVVKSQPTLGASDRRRAMGEVLRDVPFVGLKMAVFEAPDEVPADLPAPNAPIEHHHYGVGGLNYVYTGYRMYAYRVIGLRVFNGAEGGPTVWHSYMPGCTWDGTSCFNFNKELINRYYSGEKKDVFATLTLSDEAKAKLAEAPVRARRIPWRRTRKRTNSPSPSCSREYSNISRVY